jgi:hypothetical protein
MTLTEHIERNRQYANETDETALVQVRHAPGSQDWHDLARTTPHRALGYAETANAASTYPRHRVVDWITREVITE